MTRGRHGLSAMLLLAGLAGVDQAASQPAGPSEGPAIVFVFDNSGSMWGKLEGDKTPKLSVAREAVAGALEKLRPNIRTGLVTFGRRRGDCSDVEVVARPESGDADRINEPLEKLNPKGRGPIVLAAREAAKVAHQSRLGSVILIHDDPDNCQQDACAAASEIKRDHPGVRVHVISMGLKKEDVPRVSCLAQTTGGRHYDAQSGSQVATFIEASVALASTDASRPLVVPAPVPVARPADAVVKASTVAVRRPAKPPAQGASGLWLGAVHPNTGELIDAPVRWRVLKASGGGEIAVFDTQASEARTELPAGSYTVEARHGLVSTRQTVEVAADRPTPMVMQLNTGSLQVRARARAGGPPIDQVTFTLYEGAVENPAKPPIWIGRDPTDVLGLAPGPYRLVAERGFARAQTSAAITPGATANIDMVLGAGLLTLRAASREDGETLTDAVFIVSEDDPEAPQGRREITRSAAATPDFVLPAGTYTVTTRIGGGEARERVAVGAGESVKRTMLLGLGRLTITARVEQPAGQPPWREPVLLRVLRRDADAREVARTSTNPHSLELPSGPYRIEAQVGGQNAKATRDIEVLSGRTTQVAFELPAARTTLRLAPGMGPAAAGDIAWEVRDDTRRVVWRSNHVEPRLVLAPGRYTVRLLIKDRDVERQLTLRAGEARTFDVGPE